MILKNKNKNKNSNQILFVQSVFSKLPKPLPKIGFAIFSEARELGGAGAIAI
jgi:hypothetical protein